MNICFRTDIPNSSNAVTTDGNQHVDCGMKGDPVDGTQMTVVASYDLRIADKQIINFHGNILQQLVKADLVPCSAPNPNT